MTARPSRTANLNLSYMPYFYIYRENGFRDRPDGVDRSRTVREKMRGFVYEVGGDYAFNLGPGRLKLIGLRKFDHEPIVSTVITTFADGSRFDRRPGRPRRPDGRMDRPRRI